MEENKAGSPWRKILGLVGVTLVLAVLVYLFGMYSWKGSKDNKLAEPEGDPAISGIIDEWRIEGNTIHLIVGIGGRQFRQFVLSTDKNTSYRVAQYDPENLADKRVLAEGSLDAIKTGMNVEVFLRAPEETKTPYVVDTIVYYRKQSADKDYSEAIEDNE